MLEGTTRKPWGWNSREEGLSPGAEDQEPSSGWLLLYHGSLEALFTRTNKDVCTGEIPSCLNPVSKVRALAGSQIHHSWVWLLLGNCSSEAYFDSEFPLADSGGTAAVRMKQYCLRTSDSRTQGNFQRPSEYKEGQREKL